MSSGEVGGMAGAILFLLPWVVAGVFVGIFPEPRRMWLRVPYLIAGAACALLAVIWDGMLVLAALS